MSVRLLLIVLAVIAGLWLADRLLLAAEARGHIYYRRRKASPRLMGNAMLEVQALFEPGQAKVIEMRRAEEEAEEEDAASEPPHPPR